MSILLPDDTALDLAARLLSQGELVAFPTETVYGLGANAYSAAAVRKIFAAKNRPSVNPLIVHLPSAERLEQAVALPLPHGLQPLLDQLVPLWPGPLTLVLPKSPQISAVVTAGLPTVAVRVPDHPVALQLLQRCSFPVAAPSANPANYVSPTTAQHVSAELGERVKVVLDGGPCQYGIESTILSLVDSPPRILRLGSITPEQLAQRLQFSCEVLMRNDGPPHAPPPQAYPSPGRMPEHYAPHTPLVFEDELPATSDLRNAGLIALHRPPPSAPFARIAVLSPGGSLEVAAAQLYAALRAMDQAGLDLLVVQRCEEVGIGRAIMDRLRRATARTGSRKATGWEDLEGAK